MDYSNPQTAHTEMILLTCSYILFALMITAPLGFFLTAYKMKHYKNLEKKGGKLSEEFKLIESHYEWLSQTFVFTVLMLMAAIGTIYFLVGYLFAAMAIIYWFYRLIRGAILLAEHRTTPIFA